ncbi:PGF-pre-PGF domain-containing protein [Methanosarcina sp. UBA5]|uniref:PGF-pre-PGF domain-containing protein n=1 Tax=Methanosarcina sp. UBA5 TaxID=1915593 RepID=UPI0025D536D5|nr:PGF-pre-PGF domain-containing protein [Methanosarcina sp. UBA5]
MKNKKKLYSIALASATLVFMISILISPVASAAQVTRIGNGSDPAIYGSKVVWTDSGVIHVYDLTARTDTTVSSSAASHPAIYGNKLVWRDESSGVPRLTVYDIPSGARSYITEDVDNSSIPSIYGNRIVWSANYNELDYNYSIYMRDISTSTQTKIAKGNSPDICDTKIAYGYEDADGRNIAVYDINTNEPIKVDSSSQIFIPHIYGNKVIWSNFYSRDGFIQMYDLVTKKAIDVTSDNTGNTLPEYADSYTDAGDDTGTHIDINGDKIVYSKSGDDQFGYAGVYVYDIPSAKSTPVYIYPRDTYTTPDIYNDTIVWGINGNYDGYGEVNNTGIYMCDLSATNTLPPVAEFTANTTYGAAPLVVLFTDNSTGGVPTSWIWNFGDRTYSKHAMNATHTFTKPGSYTISLTAGNDAGNNKVVKPNYIVVTNPLPVANFSSNITEGYPPLSIQFTDLSENATGWNWDFGDGSNSTQKNPVHEYADPGIYSVNLTAINENGTDSRLTTITVMQLVGVGPYAYITNSGDNNVSVIDTATNKVTAMIPVGNYPMGVAVTPDGKNVYVTNFFGHTISVIDATKNKVTATIPVENAPRGVAVSPDGKRVYVPHPDLGNPSNNTILIIDTATNEVEATVLVGKIPFGVAVALDGKKVYVTNLDDKTVSVIDTAANTVIATIPVGNNPRGVAISPDGKRVYVACDEGSNNGYIYVIDAVKNKVTATALVGSFPDVVAVTPNGNRVYVTNGLSNTISVIDTATNKVIATIPVGSTPDGVAVTPDGSKVYVTNYLSNNVSVIDTSTNKVTATMSVGHGPNSFGQFIGSLQVQSIFPVADFNSNVTEGYAPLTVQFNDLSQKAASRIWDFNGDGQPDSSDTNPVYVYASPGTYTVNLTVSNGNGTASKTAIINVLTPSSSSGGSSHSSGGGGGGSPEPQSNVQIKELSQATVVNGKLVKFDFPKNATCVVYVSFDAKKTFGKTTTIAEQLKGKSFLVSGSPLGEVYKFFNVWVENGGIATSKNIENPVVCFKVEKVWIKEKKINPDSITLNRYNDKKWEQFPVSLSGKDDRFLYFTAKTSGFSSFAITGTVKPSETTTKIEVDYPETINKNNTENKEPQAEQKEILKTTGFEIYYGIASLLAVLLYKRK